MRIGIISGIHSNFYAARDVFTKLEREFVDTIICLGDIVGYGPHPNEVINLLRRKNVLALQGEHDLAVIDSKASSLPDNTVNNFSVEFTRQEITKNNSYYLSNLPKSLVLNFENINLRCVSTNLYEDKDKTFSEQILVYGGTNISRNEKDIDQKLVISPGSCGKPSVGNDYITFGILEVTSSIQKFDILKGEYDFLKIQKDMKMMKFPEILINSYETGVC